MVPKSRLHSSWTITAMQTAPSLHYKGCDDGSWTSICTACASSKKQEWDCDVTDNLSKVSEEAASLRQHVKDLQRDLEVVHASKLRLHEQINQAWDRALAARKKLVKIRHRERDIRLNLLFKSL